MCQASLSPYTWAVGNISHDSGNLGTIVYFVLLFFFTRSVSGSDVFFHFEFLFTTGTQNKTAGKPLTKLDIKTATIARHRGHVRSHDFASICNIEQKELPSPLSHPGKVWPRTTLLTFLYYAGWTGKNATWNPSFPVVGFQVIQAVF